MAGDIVISESRVNQNINPNNAHLCYTFFMKERHWLLFPLVFVAYETTCYLANDMYLPALPSIALDLQADQHLAQLTLTWWFVGTATFQLLLGPLADRYGRRSVLFGGGLLFITSLWVCVFTNNIYVMIVARF